MDPFGQLPPEVLVLVASSIPDLASLHSLRLASPACAAVLATDSLGADIIEAVAAASLAKGTRALVAYAWLLLSRPVPAWSAALDLTNRTSASLAASSQDIAPNARATLQLLALAKVAYLAAHRCLDALLRRLIGLQPRRPVDPTFDCRRHRFWRNTAGRPFEPPPQPPSEPAELDITGAAAPLEWVEEQRALYGAWQLALFGVMRSLSASCGWSPGETESLLAIGPAGMWKALAEAAPGVCSGDTELLSTILDGALHTHSQRLSDAYTYPSSVGHGPCRSVGIRPPDPAWNPGPNGLGAYRRAWIFFINARMMAYSPLRTASFAPFRALGFAVWEEPRLSAMGLLSSHDIIESRFGGRGRLGEYSDMYAWKSVLTEDELEALEAAQRAAWPIVS